MKRECADFNLMVSFSLEKVFSPESDYNIQGAFPILFFLLYPSSSCYCRSLQHAVTATDRLGSQLINADEVLLVYGRTEETEPI